MSEESLTSVEEPIIQLTENGAEGFEVLCRLCANRSDHLIPIYSEEGVSNDLADKMNMYLPVKISRIDVLPLQCCFQCATTVLTWHELVVASVEADRRLREVQAEVEKQIVEQEEPGPSQTETVDDDRCTEKTKYLCEYCSYMTGDHKIFNKHLIIHSKAMKLIKKHDVHINKNDVIVIDNIDESCHFKQNIKCEMCSKKFKQTSNLNIHLNSHVKDFFCYVCCKSFINNFQLEQHLSFHTEKQIFIYKNNPATVNCPYTNCFQMFPSKQQLYQHKQSHENITQYCCNKCPKKFKHLKQLERHCSQHKNTECSICNKEFSSKIILSEHMRLHSGVKPFKCEVCHMMFRYRSGLVVHKKAHSNERKYKCGQCEKAFTRSNYLREHLRIHLKVKPFACKFCDMKFTQQNVLNTHTARKHRSCPICRQPVGNILKIRMHLWKMHNKHYQQFINDKITKIQ